MTNCQVFQYQSPVGGLGLSYQDKQFVGLAFVVAEIVTAQMHGYAAPATDFLDRYFSRQPMNRLALHLQGTDFQCKVWQTLLAIPYAETRTYGELAHQLGSSPRAIGQAVRRNPFPIFIPCHRVVAQNGLGGFDGHRQGRLLQIKQWLLDFEHTASPVKAMIDYS